MKGAVERAVHGVEAVDALDGGAFFFRSYETHRDVDAANYEHSVFLFDFPSDFRGELVVACIDLTRFQRASESSHHSTSGAGDDVVDGGGVGVFYFVWRDFVMLGDRAVDAKDDGLRLAGEMSDAKRAGLAFDLYV